MAAVTLEVAREALARHGSPVQAVGVSTQRASTVVWDRATGQPIGPGLGWQDLRTVFDCIMAKANHGLALAPNQSATKLAWLLDNLDPDRSRDLCFGTVDSWIAWVLTEGTAHVTDRSNAAVTGLTLGDASDWNDTVLGVFRVPRSMMPRLVDTSGPIAPATALPGAPMLSALVGDQQASLVGQSCVRPGDTKITFGTGGMLDVCVGPTAPASANRSSDGTFPIVGWSIGGVTTWGVEAIMLSAGTNVERLRDDLGLIATAAESHEVAQRCASTDGVVFVPALLGLGTPHWDYGARGALFGLSRGSDRAHVVRAVLEGIAHRGADLVDAAEVALGSGGTGRRIDVLRIDGGMSRNPTFVQALADAAQRPVETAPVADATTVGEAGRDCRIQHGGEDGESYGEEAKLPDLSKLPAAHEAHIQKEEAKHSPKNVTGERSEGFAALLTGDDSYEECSAEQEDAAVRHGVMQHTLPRHGLRTVRGRLA
jgi:glycerol kinase